MKINHICLWDHNVDLSSPMTLICKRILEAIPKDKPLKLTATGALPQKLVKEVYAEGILPHYNIEKGFQRLNKELDWPLIHIARILCEISGLARNTKGKWVLTEKGRKALKRPGNLLEILFTNFCIEFAWSYLDRYNVEFAGQFGFGYSLFLLNKYGQTPEDTKFYAQKFILAFPMAVEGFTHSLSYSKQEQFSNCYIHRTFTCCLHWFGLVLIHEKGMKYEDDHEQSTYVTPLFREFIKVNIDPPDTFYREISRVKPDTRTDGVQQELFPTGREVLKPLAFQPDLIISPPRSTGRNESCPCGSGKKYKHCCAQYT